MSGIHMNKFSKIFFAAAFGGIIFSTAPSVRAQPRPMPVATNDESGFVQIFDGKTLNGWAGDPQYWHVENGALVGEVTATNLLKVNSFIVWRGGETRDFELKVAYRVSARGNSGINYRSEMATNFGPWAMRGYQADIDGANQYTGQNYEDGEGQQHQHEVFGRAELDGLLGHDGREQGDQYRGNGADRKSNV